MFNSKNYIKKYLEQISFEIVISFGLQCNDTRVFFDFTTVFTLSGMGSTIIALETHDNQIGEIWNAGLTHFHLSRQFAGVAWHLENNWLLLHKIILFKRFGEVDFGTDSFGFNLLYLLLSVLFAVAHCD